MFTRFEEYAASSMLGDPDSPPRRQGRLYFGRAWERQLFGLTLAVSKEGHFEWEDFRRRLIRAIGEWEALDCADQPPWDYYERFLAALEDALAEHGVVGAGELQARLAARASS